MPLLNVPTIAIPNNIVSDLMYLGALIAVLFVMITTGIFFYHWIYYGGNRKLAYLTVFAYFGGAVFVIFLMLGAIVTYLS